MPAEFNDIPEVEPCDVPPGERNLPPSCSREDAYTRCTPFEIDVDVPEDLPRLRGLGLLDEFSKNLG